MLRRLLLLPLIAMSAALILPVASARAETTTRTTDARASAFRYFADTGHSIGFKVRDFYEANGDEAVFGKPLTDVISEDGMRVQYFERARFELRPGAPVALTRLGSLYIEGRTEPAFQWQAQSPGADWTFFPESGHSLTGAFRYYWQMHGGVNAFGFPVSEELKEANPTNGQTYTVQYFERARFEYHPELAGQAGEVQLMPLGRWLLNQHPNVQKYAAPMPQLTLLGQATTGYRTSASEREFNIARATEMFDGVIVAPGEEYSFANSGDFSEDAGFVDGYAIVDGKLEKVIGGGLCQVSTTMFRAVSNAGLAITSRTGHTYVVYFYENILGFDATVFTPYVDFRWRNDTSGPVYIATSSDAQAATVTFQVYGVDDGRTVSYRGPVIRNVVQPGKPIWQFDPKLKPGEVQQLVHGRAGMDVNYYRTVTMPNGAIKHNDTFFTHYKPWEDYYTYGPGVR
ncbi:MAG TPA: VanW family protein [Roseiflexaceae bacterium]|nr:VanW family protein [Roseiflexaceae bacterium]